MEEKKRAFRETDSLRFKFSVIFAVFSICILIFTGIAIYTNQMKSYKKLCLEHVRNVGLYLEKLIQDSGEEFINYQNYYMEHFAEVDIPYDFDEYGSAYLDFQALLANKNPERLSKPSDIRFANLSDEEKKAYFIYWHKYWLLTFEHARKAFDLPYTYYLVPKEEESIMVYMIDGERTHKGPDGKKAEEGEYLYLGDEYIDPPARYPVQWNTWFTGKMQDDFQVWDNEWGYTYAYYVPLIINGQKYGLIGTEINVDKINKTILNNTLWQSGVMAIGLTILLILLLLCISQRYIRKILLLESQVRKFSIEKDLKITYEIKSNFRGWNEIDLLGKQFADMIQELEKYMRNLLATNKELIDAKQQARIMNELAYKDSLTGIRNKNSFDSEMLRIKEQAVSGKDDFGFGLIKLKNLKRTNENFGQDRGNIAIKSLCEIVCEVFKHSPVFRFDEDIFAVVLENSDYRNIEQLVRIINEEFESLKSLKGLDPWERVSATVGYALYDEKLDSGVQDVLERAQQAVK